MTADFKTLYPYTTIKALPFSEEQLGITDYAVEFEQVQEIAKSTRLSEDIIEGSFEVRQRLKVAEPVFLRRSSPLFGKTLFLKNTFFATDRQAKYIFITTQAPALYGTESKERAIRIFRSFLLQFDTDGTFKQKIDTVSFLATLGSTEGELTKAQQKVIRRISNTQTLGRSEHVPECYAFLEYQGKKGLRKVIYFQKRAFSDLRSYFEGNSKLFSCANSELMMLHIAKKILTAILFVHEKGLLHKDVKSENFLLESEPSFTEDPQPNVKITDFDRSCKFIDAEGLRKLEGTADWLPPEFYYNKPPFQGLVHEVWCTGLVLHKLTEPNGQAEVHRRHEFRNDCIIAHHAAMIAVQKLAAALKAAPNPEMQQRWQAEQDDCKKWQVRMEEAEKSFRASVEALVWPSTITTLKHIAQRMIQKDPERRISFETALLEVDNLINLKKVERASLIPPVDKA